MSKPLRCTFTLHTIVISATIFEKTVQTQSRLGPDLVQTSRSRPSGRISAATQCDIIKVIFSGVILLFTKLPGDDILAIFPKKYHPNPYHVGNLNLR